MWEVLQGEKNIPSSRNSRGRAAKVEKSSGAFEGLLGSTALEGPAGDLEWGVGKMT